MLTLPCEGLAPKIFVLTLLCEELLVELGLERDLFVLFDCVRTSEVASGSQFVGNDGGFARLLAAL